MKDPDSVAVVNTLDARYSFEVVADGKSGYTIEFPDLPGCLTQVEDLDELPKAADEARRLWIETELARGNAIPPPFHDDDFSGRFNLRLPKSLHRRLVRSAAREGISLNQFVMTLLDRTDALARVEHRLADLERGLEGLAGRRPGG